MLKFDGRGLVKQLLKTLKDRLLFRRVLFGYAQVTVDRGELYQEVKHDAVEENRSI